MTAIDIALQMYWTSASEGRIIYSPLEGRYNGGGIIAGSFANFNIGPLDVPNNTFPDFSSARSHYDSGKISDLLSQMNSVFSPETFTAGESVEVNDQVVDDRLDALEGASSGIPATFDDLTDGTTNKAFTETEKTKLAGIATGATANDTDANLKDRANHTGTQVASTISDFTEAAQDAVGGALSSEFVYTDGSNSIGLRQRSFANTASRSLTTSTGAAGFQVSSSRDAWVNYNVTTSTTATLIASASVTAVLEIAPTNSATPGDWVEISRVSNGQTLTLGVTLQSVQTGAGNLGGVIPAGYYAKLRTTTTGTASATYNTGQEVLA